MNYSSFPLFIIIFRSGNKHEQEVNSNIDCIPRAVKGVLSQKVLMAGDISQIVLKLRGGWGWG